MTALWWKVLGVAALVGLLAYGWNRYQTERQQRTIAELRLVTQRAINDSTEAKLTIAHVDREQLAAALKAAADLNGTLVAALKIRVPKRDTFIVHDTIPTELAVDSTRTATFRDSTFAGTIAGTVIAPPCCANLGITYQITRPAFSPTIAFVEVAGKTVASVTWQGEHIELDAPYARPQPKKLRFLGAWAEANYRLVGGDSTYKNIELNGGALIRLSQAFRVHAGVSTDATAFVGVRKEF